MKTRYAKYVSFSMTVLLHLMVSSPLAYSPASNVQAVTSLSDKIINFSDNRELKVTILHTNDTHAHLENIPRRFTAIHQIRNTRENTLLLDAGDVFSGVRYFNQFLGQADIKFMNEIGYDAMTLGNHEFDKSSEVLRNFIRAAAFPLVSANIDLSKDKKLKNLAQPVIGTPGNPGVVYPAVIKVVDGQKVGIIGLTTEKTTILSNPNKNIIFEDAFKHAKDTVTSLEEKGVNKIIVISHLGYDRDKDLAKNLEGIDIIVGSHSHTKLKKPDVYNQEKEPTLIVQAGKHGKYLGDLDLTFDESGKLIKWKGKLINIMKKDQEGDFLYQEDEWAKKYLEELKSLK
ncbi:metallophosphoesterase [Peribacillus sp. NPDC097206]|uniref:metallophosphoesterase n=1 Tax=unclassified Peribacillus TaxID=2675266 RepID=UPI0037F7D844